MEHRWPAAIILVSGLLCACSGGNGATSLVLLQPSQSRAAHGNTTASPIQHVVIVIQENRSFDNLFNGFPHSNTVRTCLNSQEQQVAMAEVPLIQDSDLDHAHSGFLTDYDNGKMDGFLNTMNGEHNPLYSCQYTRRSDVALYWALALEYTLADRMFSSQNGPSFTAHQFLIAGQSTINGDPNATGPWGCDGVPPACYTYENLGEEMDALGVTWRYYSYNGNGIVKGVEDPSIINKWQAMDASSQVRYGSDWTNGDVGDVATLFTDISSGDLPQVTWITPAGGNSDHPAADHKDGGPEWVTSIVDAIGASQYWNSSAIFIVWDDWGGWYDHVAPPQRYKDGLGFRVPLIVVSPYAKQGYVSHVQHEFGSILHFAEEQFGLPSLGERDAESDDLSDCFDFAGLPVRFRYLKHGPFAVNDHSPPDDY